MLLTIVLEQLRVNPRFTLIIHASSYTYYQLCNSILKHTAILSKNNYRKNGTKTSSNKIDTTNLTSQKGILLLYGQIYPECILLF